MDYPDTIELLSRFYNCDWGDIEETDWETNNDDLDKNIEQGRILASYKHNETVVWFILEVGDGSIEDAYVLTILLPEEY